MSGVESPAPTPQALYRRLRQLSEATSDELLARELDVPTRTLTRLKAGEGTVYETTIRLLAAAGWLNLDGASDPRARLYQAQQFVNRSLQELLELREAVEGAFDTLPSDDQSA